MSSKGFIGPVTAFAFVILLALGSFVMIEDANGTAPEVNSVVYSPLQPSVDDQFNISVVYNVYDEPIVDAKIQTCVDGVCNFFEQMESDGSGTNFWKLYAPNSFQADKIIEFHLYIDYGQGLRMMHGQNVTFAPVPEDIFLNASLSTNTLKPNQTVEVNGNLTYDIGGMVEGADINLSISSLGIFEKTLTDEGGNFSVELQVPAEGEHTLSLNASFGIFYDEKEWLITVSPWDLPNLWMEVDGIDFDELDSPPGAPVNTFYTDSNVTLEVNIHNTGTDSARNITSTITIENATQVDTLDVGDLLVGERYPADILLNTTEVGYFDVNITVEWDQEAPFPDNFTRPSLSFRYEIVPRPEWTGHTVFVEMFTQTTCAPCVYIEEALEELHHEGLDFEFVVYVTEDTESSLIAEAMNITATPVIFVDDDIFRKDGSSDDLEAEMEEIRELIEDAASLERPPVSMQFTNGETVDLNSHLDPEYRDTVSGIIEIYRVEAHSNLRNYQGIPMSNRYLGSVAGQEVNDLQPGDWYNFSVDRPAPGEALLAVLVDDDGTVIQTTVFDPNEEPDAYLGVGQVILNLGEDPDTSFNFTLERFQTEDTSFDDVEVLVTESGFPAGWNIAYSTGTLSPPGVMVELTYSDAVKDVRPVGRVRYSQDHMVTLTIPDNTTGTFDFNLEFEVRNYTYTMLVVVIVPEPGVPEIEITDAYLLGEGQAIYFYVEATGIPDGAKVRGRILPCNYGPNAACGLPQDFLLTRSGEGKYRASVIGVDLETYTHLTYSAWVEYEDVTYSQTEEVQVEISSLIEVEEDDEDGIPWILILSICGLLVLIIIVVVWVLMARRGKEEEPIEEIEGEVYKEEVSSEEEVPGEVAEGEVPEGDVDEAEPSDTMEDQKDNLQEGPVPKEKTEAGSEE